MYAKTRLSIEINDEETPRHNEYIQNEYKLNKLAADILTSQLVMMATHFSKTGSTDEIFDFVRTIHMEIEKKPKPSYYQQTKEDAIDFIDELTDEIVEQFLSDGEIGEDIRNDFAHGDSLFHETIVDRWYSPEDAIMLLSNLHEWEETDEGLWEGQDWEEIISMKAAWTYGNAVYEFATDVINQIRDAIDMDELDLEVANEVLDKINNDIASPYEFDDDDEMLELIKENHIDEFNEKLEAKLRASIEEELK